MVEVLKISCVQSSYRRWWSAIDWRSGSSMSPLDYDEDDIYTAQVTERAEALRAPAQHRNKTAKKEHREEKKSKKIIIIKSTTFPNSSFIIFESRVRHTGCDCQVRRCSWAELTVEKEGGGVWDTRWTGKKKPNKPQGPLVTWGGLDSRLAKPS